MFHLQENPKVNPNNEVPICQNGEQILGFYGIRTPEQIELRLHLSDEDLIEQARKFVEFLNQKSQTSTPSRKTMTPIL